MKKRIFQFAFVACLALGMSSQVNAQIFTNASGDGLWSNAANWDNGVVPTGADDVVLGDENNTGVTANFDLAAASVNDFRIGSGVGTLGASGTFNQSSGTLTANGWSFVGSDANPANSGPTAGTFNLSGNAQFINNLAGNEFHVGIGGGAGATGSGVVNVSDTATLSSHNIRIGSNDGNSGTLNVSGGLVEANFDGNSFLTVGSGSATGLVNQSAGTVASNNWITIGEGAGSSGEYNLSGGALTTSNLTVGQADAGTTGELNVSGSSSVTADSLWVGRGEFGGAGATGLLEIVGSNATVLANGDVHFGGFNFAAADAVGDLSFIADAFGVTTLDIAGSLFLNDGSGVGASNLLVDLTADANFGTFGTTGTAFEYLLVDNFNNGVTGEFAGLAEGASISIGGGLTGTISYVGGDGNDIVINLFTTAVPEPSAVLIASLGMLGLMTRRRRS